MAEASAGSRSAAVAGGGGVVYGWRCGVQDAGGTGGGVVLRADDAEVGSVVSRII